MFIFWQSFSALYPTGNSINIESYIFKNLTGETYTYEMGSPDLWEIGKMAWTNATDPNEPNDKIRAPFYFPKSDGQKWPPAINVYV